jgi:apolipoprotein N-acyltransferase
MDKCLAVVQRRAEDLLLGLLAAFMVALEALSAWTAWRSWAEGLWAITLLSGWGALGLLTFSGQVLRQAFRRGRAS